MPRGAIEVPLAILKSPDGSVRRIEAAENESLMRAAVRHGVEGIVAECGGECACATCHVYVDERFYVMLQPPSAAECELLDFVAAERKTTSRLSCQIELVAGLDGIEATLPDRQV
jgi:2Fe-2S ferredoxin